jgi:ribulose-phosphate 3-epimerase
MIENPKNFIDDFVNAGSDMITVHIETVSIDEIKRLKAKLSKKKIKFGISLNPATPLAKIRKVLNFIDFVLVMSVNPGFSGQEFIPKALPKIRQLRSIFKGDIAVDGGVNDKVAGKIIKAGANILACGSYVFGAKDTQLAIQKIRNAG